MTRVARRLIGAVASMAAAGMLAGCFATDALDTGGDQLAAAAQVEQVQPPKPDWRRFFDSLSKGAILVNLDRRFLAYWGPDGETYDVFPIAAPLNEELRRTGLTSIVRRKENPEWRPTPSMRERMPDLPDYIGPGPQNPLGERALYLGWQYYAIHGTNDQRSIGDQVTSGCIRLRSVDILWLYEHAEIGTPVRVMDDFEI